jgi:hypothetical protein
MNALILADVGQHKMIFIFAWPRFSEIRADFRRSTWIFGTRRARSFQGTKVKRMTDCGGEEQGPGFTIAAESQEVPETIGRAEQLF